MEKKITPYPKNFKLTDTCDVTFHGDQYKHVHIKVFSNEGHTFRIKEDVLIAVFKGELKTLKVKFLYNIFYLVLPTEKSSEIKLKNGEVACKTCNEFGYVLEGVCPICKGKRKLDWLEQVFVQEKRE